MVKQIEKILYTTDLSESSIEVFEQTVSLAARTGASITLLHVIEDKSSSSSQNRMVHLVDIEVYEKIRNESRDEVKNVLIGKQRTVPVIQNALQALCDQTNDKVCKVADTPVVIDNIEVHFGNAADVITLIANTMECDLIVMGYHKKGSILKSLMGGSSAGKNVIKQSKCPIFLVPIDD